MADGEYWARVVVVAKSETPSSLHVPDMLHDGRDDARGGMQNGTQNNTQDGTQNGTRDNTAEDVRADTHVGVTIAVRSLVPFLYRNGSVKTGVDIRDIRTTVTHDSLIVRPFLVRQGNAAFIGTLSAVLRDEAGHQVGTGELPLGVYYTLCPHLAIAVPGIKPGTYTLTISLASQRVDMDNTRLLPSPPVHRSVQVTVPRAR
jgi:hypothetical protein